MGLQADGDPIFTIATTAGVAPISVRGIKPMIQYVVEEAGGKRAIEDHFDSAFELEYYLNDRGKTDELAQIKTISETPSSKTSRITEGARSAA